MAQGLGTVFPGGVSVTTDGNSAVSAYGPRLGRDVAVVAQTVPASDSIDTTFAVTGAAIGDTVILGAPSTLSADVIWHAFVPSAGNVTLRLSNSAITAVNQVAATWSVDILRRSFVTRLV